MSAKYTFLLPAYKGNFLREMLLSIQSQTYPDYNVIVSDDCSPEDLYSTVEPFLYDTRFSYRRNEKNYGAENLVDHWNLLLGLTKSEYIIMASDDDFFDPTYLESIDNLSKIYPGVRVLRPRVRRIDSNNNVIEEECMSGNFFDLNSFLSLWASYKLFSGIPYYVFHRQSLISNGGFEKMPYAWFSDDATVVKQIVDCGVAITEDILFSFRLSPYSISSKYDSKSVKGKFQAAEMYYEFIRKYSSYYTLETLTKARQYISISSKSEFLLAHSPLNMAIYSLFHSSYSSFRWKLSLFKAFLRKSCSIK